VFDAVAAARVTAISETAAIADKAERNAATDGRTADDLVAQLAGAG
jgi:hypothetical protein